jgi:hypothetical protein
MTKKIKYITNAPLEVGDNVIYIKMDDPFSNIKPGTPGKVVRIDDDTFGITYRVHWLDGSKLGLVDGVDTWRKVVNTDVESNLQENIILSTTKGKILKGINK